MSAFRDLVHSRQGRAQGPDARPPSSLEVLAATRTQIPPQGVDAAPREVALQARLRGSPSKAAFGDYPAAVQALRQRRQALIGVLEQTVPKSSHAETVRRLRCLRGIDTHGRWPVRRNRHFGFQKPSLSPGFLGVAPSEYTSDEKRTQGQITKAGPPNARHLLVEAVHHYRHRPAVGLSLATRQDGQDRCYEKIGRELKAYGAHPSIDRRRRFDNYLRVVSERRVCERPDGNNIVTNRRRRFCSEACREAVVHPAKECLLCGGRLAGRRRRWCCDEHREIALKASRESRLCECGCGERLTGMPAQVQAGARIKSAAEAHARQRDGTAARPKAPVMGPLARRRTGTHSPCLAGDRA